MAILTLDFSVGSDELIPEADYAVVIDKVEAKESRSNDEPNLNWTFTIAEGAHKGRKVFLTTGTSEKARWKLRETLEALGVFEEGMPIVTDDDSNVIVQPQLAGLAAVAAVRHREWQGKKRAGVESVKPANGASLNGGPQFR